LLGQAQNGAKRGQPEPTPFYKLETEAERSAPFSGIVQPSPHLRIDEAATHPRTGVFGLTLDESATARAGVGFEFGKRPEEGIDQEG
jgi:hypothetical protein